MFRDSLPSLHQNSNNTTAIDPTINRTMRHRLRATKRTLSSDETGDYRIQKITKKAARTVNPQNISRSAILSKPPSASATPGFATGPKLDFAAAKHPRVLAISESEAWFGKTMMPNRQPRPAGYRGSPLANTNGDTETIAAKKCGLPAEHGAGAEGMAAGHHADMSVYGMGGNEELALRGLGEGRDVGMQDAEAGGEVEMV